MTEILPIEKLQNNIYEIRGLRVMLDKDLANLYKVETRVLNQSVKRNISRFPEEFMFELTREEIMRISQFVTSLKFSKRVYAFTEHGIVMLSSVLNSEFAAQVNIQIVKAFIKLKQMIIDYKELRKKIESIEHKYDKQFQVVFETIKQLIEIKEKPRRPMGFRKE